MTTKPTTKRSIVGLTTPLAVVGWLAASAPIRYATMPADGAVKVFSHAARINTPVIEIGAISKEGLVTVYMILVAVCEALTSVITVKKDMVTRGINVYPEYN